MIKAILFDLDNTLIQNPPEEFTRSYVLQLIPFLQTKFPHLEREVLGNAIRQGILGTIADKDPLKLNIEVFAEKFTAITNIPATDYIAVLREYLRDLYPNLKSWVQPREASIHLVEWLLANRYAIAVATNPLFLREAVIERMGWGNLTLEKHPFWFITTFETMHFTKPNMEYFEEILSRLGFEPDEALMVGDDWDNDVAPAAKAGLNTYWITSGNQTPPTKDVTPDGMGTMDDLLACIVDENWLETLHGRPLTPEQIAPRLRGNIAALLGLVQEIPDHFWNQHPDPNEWSPLEIVVHLRDRETDVQRARLRRILREDNPFLVSPEEPPAPGSQDLHHEDGRQVVMQFAAARQETLDFLATLTHEQWQRPARHSVFGPTSLLEMAAFTARHDRLHINQLCQTLGKCE